MTATTATRLIVFDWDGTLSDSLDRIVTCLQISAQEVGLPVPTDDQGREIIGLGLGEALASLFPDAGAGDLVRLRESYARHYPALDREPSPFYETVRETLDLLRERGYLLAVATGKSRRGLDRVLHSHGMADFFDASRCADESASKPDPRMLRELLEHFAVAPEEACMVGDTEFDMVMAVRANMARIGVSYGAHAAERLDRHGLRGCADRLADMIPWV